MSSLETSTVCARGLYEKNIGPLVCEMSCLGFITDSSSKTAACSNSRTNLPIAWPANEIMVYPLSDQIRSESDGMHHKWEVDILRPRIMVCHRENAKGNIDTPIYNFLHVMVIATLEYEWSLYYNNDHKKIKQLCPWIRILSRITYMEINHKRIQCKF